MPQTSGATGGVQARITGDASGLVEAVGKAQDALSRFKKSAGNVIPVNFSSKVQLASYQIQDFAVQVASGTSAARAFAQQAPQLLGGFGAVGAILGTVAAIAVPLAAHFIEAGTATQSFGDAADGAAKKADALSKSLEVLATRLDDSAMRSGALSEQLVALQRIDVASKAAASVEALRQSFGALGSEMQGWSGLFSSFQASVGNANQALSGVSQNLLALVPGLTRVRGGVLSATTDTAREIVSLTATVRSWGVEADSALRIALDLSNAFKNTNSTEAAQQLANIALRLQNISTISPEARKQIDGFFASVLTLTQGTDELNKKLAQTAALMQSGLMGGIGSYGGGQRSGSGTTISNAPEPNRPRVPKYKPAPNENPSQEGGQSLTDRLKVIQDRFKTEQILLQQQYLEDRMSLQDALNKKLITEQQYYEASKKLADEHARAVSSIQSTRLNSDLAAVGSFFGSMQSAAESGGKKMLKVAKAFGAAQALVATFQAAAQAMADWSNFTPAGKLAAYAAIMAQGMSAVAAIKGVTEGGGGGGGGGGGRKGRGGMAAASGGGATAAAAPTTTFSFTLMNDPMGFGEKFARQFIDQLNSTQRNGGQIRGVIA